MSWPVSTRVTTDNRVATDAELSCKARKPDGMALFVRMMLILPLKTKPKRTIRINLPYTNSHSAKWIRSRVYNTVLISCDIKSLTWYGYDVLVTCQTWGAVITHILLETIVALPGVILFFEQIVIINDEENDQTTTTVKQIICPKVH